MCKMEMLARSKSGQSTIEYLLVMVVIISIALMFKVINDKFIAPYLNYALGAYIECLLETGQLPYSGSDSSAKSDYNSATSDRKINLSSNTGSSENEVSCRFDRNNIDIKAAQAEADKVNAESNANARENIAKNSASSANSSGNSSSSSSETSSAAGGASGGQGSSFSGARGGSGSGGTGPTVRRARTIGTAEMGNESSTIIIEEAGDEGSYASRNRRRRIVGTEENNKASKIVNPNANKELDKKGRVTRTEEAGGSDIVKRPLSMPPERKAASLNEDDDSGFGFGQLLKMFLIAGLIVAIVVFFGSQVMNYSNSREK